MSEIKTDKLTGTSTAGSILVTGEGNSTTTNLQQGLAKAWVNFDGTASGATVRDSLNVSSSDDDGTGVYGINVTNAFANNDFSVVGTSSVKGSYTDMCINDASTDQATTGVNKMQIARSDNQALQDVEYVQMQFCGDLA
jgi:hypothetical protein